MEVGNQVFLNPEATELVLSGPEEPYLIVLKAAVDGETLRQSRRLVLRGSGYTSNDEATAAGDQCRSLLSISFARLNFGATSIVPAVEATSTPVFAG